MLIPRTSPGLRSVCCSCFLIFLLLFLLLEDRPVGTGDKSQQARLHKRHKRHKQRNTTNWLDAGLSKSTRAPRRFLFSFPPQTEPSFGHTHRFRRVAAQGYRGRRLDDKALWCVLVCMFDNYIPFTRVFLRTNIPPLGVCTHTHTHTQTHTPLRGGGKV